MNAVAQYISDLTRKLVAEPAIRIRSTTARIRSRRHARLDTSPGEIRELASELLLRGHEFAKLNAYPEDLRAQVTLGLWDNCLPLERYFGMPDRADVHSEKDCRHFGRNSFDGSGRRAPL